MISPLAASSLGSMLGKEVLVVRVNLGLVLPLVVPCVLGVRVMA